MVKRTRTVVAAGTSALAGTGAGVAAAQTTSFRPGRRTATTSAPVSPSPAAKHPGTHTGMGKPP